MSTVFVLLENHFFRTSNGQIWCDRIINYKYLQSYLQTFDELVLCGRCMDISKDDIGDKNLVSGKGISFVALPDFVGAFGIVKNSLKIRRIIKKNLKGVNCAIIRGPSPLSLATYPVFKKSHKPFAVEFVGPADRMFDSSTVFHKIINKLLTRRAKNMCLAADGVAYVTKYTLQKAYPCRKTAFTTNYLDLKQNFFYEQKWDVKTPPECFNIVHTGYMDTSHKGQDILIDTARLMVDAGQTNFRITFIGDGRMRMKLEQMVADYGIKDYVKFAGAINDETRIRDILIKSHLFVFPTYVEGMPRALVEAMSVGLVCVAPSIDGIPEIIDRKYLVSSNESGEYAKKIIKIINDWSSMVIESRNNSKKAKEFDKSILDKRRKEFYDKLKILAIKTSTSQLRMACI